MDNPLISVIVPLFNAQKYIKQCIESILEQTYKNIELIIVDDGSTDESVDICRKIAHKDNRIRIIENEHSGAVHTRNTGITEARGEFVAFVDSDDWIDAIAIEKMYQRLEDDTDMVSANFAADPIHNTCTYAASTIESGVYSGDMLGELYQRMIFDVENNTPGLLQSTCGKLYRREVILRCKDDIDERIAFGDDALITYHAALLSRKICIMDEGYYYYRKNSTSMCHTKDIHVFEKIYYFKECMQKVIASYASDFKLERQLEYYLIHILQMGINMVYDMDMSSLYKIPKQILRQKKKIILYGAGKVGKQYYDQLMDLENVELLQWIDKGKAGEQYKNTVIESPENMKINNCDGILLAVKNRPLADNIKEQLQKQGVSEEYVLWARPHEDVLTNIISITE